MDDTSERAEEAIGLIGSGVCHDSGHSAHGAPASLTDAAAYKLADSPLPVSGAWILLP